MYLHGCLLESHIAFRVVMVSAFYFPDYGPTWADSIFYKPPPAYGLEYSIKDNRGGNEIPFSCSSATDEPHFGNGRLVVGRTFERWFDVLVPPRCLGCDACCPVTMLFVLLLFKMMKNCKYITMETIEHVRSTNMHFL